MRSRIGNVSPSTKTSSCGVTSRAGLVRISPFTLTRPAKIQSSASRREQRPTRAMILAMRSPSRARGAAAGLDASLRPRSSRRRNGRFSVRASGRSRSRRGRASALTPSRKRPVAGRSAADRSGRSLRGPRENEERPPGGRPLPPPLPKPPGGRPLPPPDERPLPPPRDVLLSFMLR